LAYYLVKSEPDAWSWEQQCAGGDVPWSGVRNPQALGTMRQMQVGDEAFFYHSNVGKEIVGLVRVTRSYYPDPDDPKSGLVDVRAVSPLPRPVSLAAIKAEPRFAHIGLVRQSRLSVMPLDDAAAALLRQMGGL